MCSSIPTALAKRYIYFVTNLALFVHYIFVKLNCLTFIVRFSVNSIAYTCDKRKGKFGEMNTPL